jgi:hypothetical protein
MENFIHKDKTYVSYEDFGAVGDGKHDDFPAIKKTHAYANENNFCVKALPAKTYYIGASPEPAVIMTDTDWSGARFIADDTRVPFEQRNADIFLVKSALEPVDLQTPPAIRKGQQRVGARLEQNALVIASNSDKKQFMRKGLNVNSGFDQTDCFIVDQSGCILTPVIWDFERVTSLTAYPIDERALLLTGGEFTTVSTRHSQDRGYSYFARGILISRSNVIVTRLVHHVADEPEERGSPYAGFVRTHACAYIRFYDCHFFGHRFYSTIGAADLPVSMGTYDITLNATIDVAFYNCRQDNIMDATRWGVIGSNGCKDILLDGCVFSRIDAHMNVTNLTVRNTTLGVQGFNAIGHGKLVLENAIVMGPSVINLRSDYGSSWDGELLIKNVTWYPPERVIKNPGVVVANNSGGHDFGYRCGFPHRVVIDGLRVMDAQHGERHECISLFGGIDESNTEIYNYVAPGSGEYPFIFTGTLIAENLTTESGIGFKIWSGDINKCYCESKYEIVGGELWPNFRAALNGVDRFEYDMSGFGHELAGGHSLAPDIRVSDCMNVVVRPGKRPANIRICDSVIEKAEAAEGGITVAYERVKIYE